MQNYLHISKKSSIFAEDLGIVPTATNKHNRVMRYDKVIFRAEGANRGLVQVVKHDDGKSIYYKVMRGRKMVDSCARYWLRDTALDRAVEICRRDIDIAIVGGKL